MMMNRLSGHVSPEVLQEEVCAALAELAKGHRENQDTICGVGAVAPLVLILRGRKIAAQVTAARALEAIADHNPAIQARFLKKSAAKHLLRLLKVGPEQVKSLFPSFLNMLMEFLSILYSCTLSCVPWAMFRVEFSRACCIKLFCHRK